MACIRYCIEDTDCIELGLPYDEMCSACKSWCCPTCGQLKEDHPLLRCDNDPVYDQEGML